MTATVKSITNKSEARQTIQWSGHAVFSFPRPELEGRGIKEENKPKFDFFVNPDINGYASSAKIIFYLDGQQGKRKVDFNLSRIEVEMCNQWEEKPPCQVDVQWTDISTTKLEAMIYTTLRLAPKKPRKSHKKYATNSIADHGGAGGTGTTGSTGNVDTRIERALPVFEAAMNILKELKP